MPDHETSRIVGREVVGEAAVAGADVDRDGRVRRAQRRERVGVERRGAALADHAGERHRAPASRAPSASTRA